MTSQDKVETNKTHTYTINYDYTTDKVMDKETQKQMPLVYAYGTNDIQRYNKGKWIV